MTALAALKRPQATDSLYASRVRVYPKDVRGPARRAKWAILAVCLLVYYATPWLRWHRGPGLPDQAILIDMWNERFYVLNLVLWPQDFYLLTGALIIAAVSLFLVTSLFGRVWCGFSCPQTVWTDLFMTVERWIEGDRNARMKRDAGALSFDTAWRKSAKHATWLGIAFWTGGAWTMYFVDAPHAVAEFWSGAASPELYVATGLLTGTTYLLAGWAREQVCTYMCPWPRFQSAMLDEQSIIVTYQGWRGEPRGHGRRAHGLDTPTPDTAKLGDCIDCMACVNVCPTGIDIRDGVQLECINCGLCVDACNEVMHKTGGKPWLITFDTLAGQAAKRAGAPYHLRLLRPRTLIYAAALSLALVGIALGLVLRADVTLSLIHDRAPLFVRLKDGGLRNGFTLKLANKTEQPAEYTLSVAGLPGATLMLSEASPNAGQTLHLSVPRSEVAALRLLVQGHPAALPGGSTTITFALRNDASGETLSYRTLFMGPAAPGQGDSQ
jgi:cytochrome c oxidase accessory protein FixG